LKEAKEAAFELILVGQEKWTVICANEEEKKKWVKNLEQASMDTISKGWLILTLNFSPNTYKMLVMV